jgi:hypothetical protein
MKRRRMPATNAKARGVTVSVVNALICDVALTRDWTIFTTDAEFAHYAKILPIKLHSTRT